MKNRNRFLGFILAGISIILIICISFSYVEYVYGGFNTMFLYPENEYEDMKTELENIIVDNRYIDKERISDEYIECNINYNKSTDGNWESCNIFMRKSRALMNATVIKSEDGMLEAKSAVYTRIGYFFSKVTELVIVIFIISILTLSVLFLLIEIFKPFKNKPNQQPNFKQKPPKV